MNTVSRMISGAVAFAIGLFVIVIAINDESDLWSLVWGVAWGVFISGVGMYLFFNKKEDDIEKIKNSKK